MKVNLECFGATDIGKCRSNNEDQFFIGELSGSMKVHHTSVPIGNQATVFGESQGHLLLVADGVGGHAAGERASALAVSAVAAFALQRLQWANQGDRDITEQLQELARDCQAKLVRSAREHSHERGMATTLTIALVCWPRLFVMHIGDSRAYLLRDNKLQQLTRDHTISQLFEGNHDDVSSGIDRPGSHALWNVVSSESDASPVADIVQLDCQLGDQLLLCTDGLYNHVGDAELCETMLASESANECCQRLISRANDRGGKDNITVVHGRLVVQSFDADPAAMLETRVPLDEVFEAKDHGRNLDDTDEFPAFHPK